MNALQVMDRYWKEVKQVSTRKNDIKVQYLYDTSFLLILTKLISISINNHSDINFKFGIFAKTFYQNKINNTKK